MKALENEKETPRPGFEPGSKAPEAFRISTTLPRLPYDVVLYGIKGQREGGFDALRDS